VSSDADPPRLSKDGATRGERRLATLVEASRRDVGSREELALLEARLLPLIGPVLPGTPGAPAGTGTTAGGPGAATAVGASSAVKLAVVSAVAATVATAAYLLMPSAPGHSLTAAPAVSSVVVAPPGAEPATRPASSASAPAEEPAPPAEPAPAPGAPAVIAPSASAAQERVKPSETELIGSAQSALSSNPARALSLCEQHRLLYPHGVLVQEREVLAIEALSNLGRHAQAVARGDRFLKAFPGSAHRSKIAAIVGVR